MYDPTILSDVTRDEVLSEEFCPVLHYLDADFEPRSGRRMIQIWLQVVCYERYYRVFKAVKRCTLGVIINDKPSFRADPMPYVATASG